MLHLHIAVSRFFRKQFSRKVFSICELHNHNICFVDIAAAQITASGKAILITGCESPLAWCLARKLDEIGFTVFAGFTKRTGNADADLLKEESSGRTKILQLDVTSETQVMLIEPLLRIPLGRGCVWPDPNL